MAKCIILGSGESARGFRDTGEADIIAINSAIYAAPNAKYWFTLDPSPANFRKMEDPNIKAIKVVAAPRNISLPKNVKRYFRVETDFKGIPKNAFERFLKWSKATTRLSTDPFCISTGNSAYGALNLAYHLGYKDITIIGVDGAGENIHTKSNAGSKGYMQLAMLFRGIEEQCRELGLNINNKGYIDAFKPTKIVTVLKSGNYRGNTYKKENVLQLKERLKKHIKIPYEFFCVTNEKIEGVNCKPLVEGVEGWYNKLQTFKEFKDFFYLDLDTVPLNNIDTILQTEGNFVAYKDVLKNNLSSCFMRVRGDYSFIWDSFIKNKEVVTKKYTTYEKWGDQAFIEDELTKRGLKWSYFDEDFFISYKHEKDKKTTPKTSFLVFSGNAKPWNTKEKTWIKM